MNQTERTRSAYATMQSAQMELDELDRTIEEELEKVKQRLDELQNMKRDARQVLADAWKSFEEASSEGT